MDRFDVKFVVVNATPNDTATADALSAQMTMAWGNDGWQIVSVVPITGTPGLLLTFQKLRT